MKRSMNLLNLIMNFPDFFEADRRKKILERCAAKLLKGEQLPKWCPKPIKIQKKRLVGDIDRERVHMKYSNCCN